MLESLKGLKDQFAQEEAAAVKAQIVVVKGGQFKNNEEATGDILDSMSLGDMMSGDMVAQTLEEINALSETMGLDNGNFTGYKDGEIIKVQLNPNSYTIASKSNFKNESMGGVKNESGTYGVFTPPEPRTLSVKLFYDTMLQADYLDKLKNAGSDFITSLTTANGLMGAGMEMIKAYQKFNGKEDLNKLYLDKLLSLTRILNKINTPPLISFQYGSTVFEGYAKQVSVEYKRFNKVGEVVRAEVTLSVEESNIFADKEAAAGSTAKTPDISTDSSVLQNVPL